MQQVEASFQLGRTVLWTSRTMKCCEAHVSNYTKVRENNSQKTAINSIEEHKISLGFQCIRIVASAKPQWLSVDQLVHHQICNTAHLDKYRKALLRCNIADWEVHITQGVAKTPHFPPPMLKTPFRISNYASVLSASSNTSCWTTLSSYLANYWVVLVQLASFFLVPSKSSTSYRKALMVSKNWPDLVQEIGSPCKRRERPCKDLRPRSSATPVAE